MPPDTCGITSAPDLGHQFGRRRAIGLVSLSMRYGRSRRFRALERKLSRLLQMYATRSSLIGLAFRTDSSARPQACTLIGAAAMPEIMPDWQHTMHAVAIGAFASAPDVGAGALGRRPASSADRFRVLSQDRGQIEVHP